MYICVTEVDADTKIPCTEAPQRTGPSHPDVKGLIIKWANSSAWPIQLSADGTYLAAPKYYGTCDDDADTSIPGVLSVLTEEEFNSLWQEEILARRPFPSWTWNPVFNDWMAPKPPPDDALINGGNVAYRWDEPSVSWAPIMTLNV